MCRETAGLSDLKSLLQWGVYSGDPVHKRPSLYQGFANGVRCTQSLGWMRVVPMRFTSLSTSVSSLISGLPLKNATSMGVSILSPSTCTSAERYHWARSGVVAVSNPVSSVNLHNCKIRIGVGIILKPVNRNCIVIYIRDLKIIPDNRTIRRCVEGFRHRPPSIFRRPVIFVIRRRICGNEPDFLPFASLWVAPSPRGQGRVLLFHRKPEQRCEISPHRPIRV